MNLNGSRIQGQITKLYYSCETFCAGLLRTDAGESIKFRTNFPLTPDEQCVLKGKFTHTQKYGWQFEATGYELHRPMDRQGLIRFLAESTRFKGIGITRAREIVALCSDSQRESLGDAFEELLLHSPESLLNISGITPEILETLKKSWQESGEVNAAITVLAGWGLSMNQISKVIGKYGSAAVKVVSHNPYSLADTIDGFGFRRADEIALKTGLDRSSGLRINACLIHLVKEELTAGHTWIEEQDLILETVKVLQLSNLNAEEIIQNYLDSLLSQKHLIIYSYHGTGVVALPQYYEMEKYLLEKLKSRAVAVDESRVANDQVATLNRGQAGALWGSLGNSLYLISGPAGSGKTYIINCLVAEFKRQDLTVMLCAPTGKAARRMEEVCEMPASTIHKILGFDGRGFQHNEDNPLQADVILVDEVSMIDIWLFYHFFKAIDFKATKLIFAGDHNQLPPVGPGNVLRDILQQGLIPFTILDEVVRQAGTLKQNSLKVLNGIVHGLRKTDPTSHDWKLVSHYDHHTDLINGLISIYRDTLKYAYKDIIKDIQVLSPMKKTDVGVNLLNRILQKYLQNAVYGRDIIQSPTNRVPKFYPGDKVIQTQNDYSLGIMNGHMGIVEQANYSQQKYLINFEQSGVIEIPSKKLKNIELAYCLTVHKVQGSEFPCVISIIHSSHYHMLHQNLFYTSVSRAKQQSYILGDSRGIQAAAKNRQVDKRRTFLALMGELR